MERFTTTSMTRRRLLAMGGSVVAVGLTTRMLPAAAHATDETLGYPHLDVSIEEKGIKVPAQVPAGLTYINLTNATKNDNLVVVWGRLADGVTKDQVDAAIAASNLNDPSAGKDDPLISLLVNKKMVLLGGPQGPAGGKTGSAIVQLNEGSHIFLDVFGQHAAYFDVTPAEAGAKTEEPKADLTVQLGNMVFVGLDKDVPAGKQLWQVENIDTMEHELIIFQVEPGLTEDDFKKQLEQMSDAGGDGAPPAGDQGGDQPPAGSEDAPQPTGVGIMAPGGKSWLPVDLAAGHYVAFCMIPMDWSGPPHALMGMVTAFDVK